MTSPSIQAVNLSKQYGSFTALTALNLTIEGSKCVGFLGPNGAGKTTTLKLFSDMIRPSKGEALINGINVHENKKKALAACGVLVETPEIYPSLTAREALSMIAEVKGVPASERKSRIDNVLSEVKMEEWKEKKVGKFSKGMKQRVNIAASLIGDPEILLLDEPTTGLDPRGMTEVRDIVKTLKKNRLVFMSSHLLNEVSEVCDEVAMIDHGKLLVHDTIANVTMRVSGDGMRARVVEVELARRLEDQVFSNRIAALDGVISVDKVDPKNLRITFQGGQDVQEKLLADLATMRIGVISFRPAASALEETYLNMIKETL